MIQKTEIVDASGEIRYVHYDDNLHVISIGRHKPGQYNEFTVFQADEWRRICAFFDSVGHLNKG